MTGRKPYRRSVMMLRGSRPSSEAPSVQPGTGLVPTGLEDGDVRRWTCASVDGFQVPEPYYQQLWFRVAPARWRSLALVATTPGASVVDLASQLVLVGVWNTGEPLSLLLGEDVGLGDTMEMVAELARLAGLGERTLVALDSVTSNPTGLALLDAVDAVVLVVDLGATDLSELEEIVAAIGREKVLGLAMRPAG